MRMFRTSIYVQFFVDLVAQTVLRDHAANSNFNHADRVVDAG